MLKLTAVFLFTVMFVSGTMNAQTLEKLPQSRTPESRANLKQVFSKETQKLKNQSSILDIKKLEKDNQNIPQKTWNTKRTVMLIAIVTVAVGLAIVLAYNTKRCIRRSPSGCNFADDINCQCLEYAK